MMNFSNALIQAISGKKLARQGWNGKGMWVCFMPPIHIPESLVNGRTKTFAPTGDLNVGGYFVMWTAKGIWQPGWFASQEDMTAEDWRVVE